MNSRMPQSLPSHWTVSTSGMDCINKWYGLNYSLDGQGYGLLHLCHVNIYADSLDSSSTNTMPLCTVYIYIYIYIHAQHALRSLLGMLKIPCPPLGEGQMTIGGKCTDLDKDCSVSSKIILILCNNECGNSQLKKKTKSVFCDIMLSIEMWLVPHANE